MSRIVDISLDDSGLPPPSPEIEQERRVAIFDLLEDNTFTLPAREGRDVPPGPYRLELSIRDNVDTDWVKANGFGGIDADRMENSLAQIATTYEFATTPDASLYFTSDYLPEGGFKLAE